MSERIKILFLGAKPTDSIRLRLDEEARQIRDKLRTTESRDSVDMVSAWAETASDLQASLLRHSPHIVHFSGHGDKIPQIFLQSHTGAVAPVDPKALKRLFSILKDELRMVVLDRCYSPSLGDAMVEVVDFTLGISEKMPESNAVSFLAGFYQALAYGRSVLEAFKLATNLLDLLDLEDATSSTLPVLLVRKGVDKYAIPFLPESPSQSSVDISLGDSVNFAGSIMIQPPEPWPNRLRRKAG